MTCAVVSASRRSAPSSSPPATRGRRGARRFPRSSVSPSNATARHTKSPQTCSHRSPPRRARGSRDRAALPPLSPRLADAHADDGSPLAGRGASGGGQLLGATGAALRKDAGHQLRHYRRARQLRGRDGPPVTAPDENWPASMRKTTPAVKRARLAEQIGWAMKDAEEEIATLTALLAKSMARTRELENVSVWHLQVGKGSIRGVAELLTRASV